MSEETANMDTAPATEQRAKRTRSVPAFVVVLESKDEAGAPMLLPVNVGTITRRDSLKRVLDGIAIEGKKYRILLPVGVYEKTVKTTVNSRIR